MRNVVVTGGTRGIGLAIAQALVASGYHPIVVARTPPLSKLGCFISWDLGKMESLKELAAKLRAVRDNDLRQQ